MTVRVRYGPSPTGEPHVGNIRTALFNWLLARHHGGQFIVRIEDTDQARKVEGAEKLIFEAMRWLGIDWDEGPDVGGPYGPYRQSERLDLYRERVQQLLDADAAYACVCSAERLDAMRKEQQARKQPPGYDGRCRALSKEELEAAVAANDGRHVVRFKMPLEGETVVPDVVRGDVRFKNRLLDDHVILKADGFPTYHLASVVDDNAMQISHVLRGEEWISSAPRHVREYEAFGWDPPVFVHLPIILGPDKGKLSKRHGATSLREYAAEGYLPEALTNFLALLGWSKDDHTVLMSQDELIGAFDVDGIGVTSAMFDVERLREMNGEYIRGLGGDAFLERAGPFLEAALPAEVERPLDPSALRPIAREIQERVKLLSEFPDYTDFFFLRDPLSYANEELMGKGYRDNPAAALAAIEATMQRLKDLELWTNDEVESALRALAEELGVKPGVLFTPIRVALTGKRVAPPLFETVTALGRELTLERLNQAAEHLARPDD